MNQFATYMRETMKIKLATMLCVIASGVFAQSGIRQFQIVSDNAQFPAPWAGNTSTNPMAWAIYDALVVRKWSFSY